MGRESELALLMQAGHRRPSIGFVQGEAGSGKSRMVAEMVRAIRPHIPVGMGHCRPGNSRFPLHPVIDALPGSGRDGVEWPSGPLVGSLLDVVRRRTPLVLVLEDVHWADDCLWEFLHLLLDEFPSDLSLILTYRDDEPRGSSWLRRLAVRAASSVACIRLMLRPLDAESLETLAVAALPAADIAPGLGERLYQRTAGIPLAAVALLRLLQQLRHAGDGEAIDPDRWIEQAGVPVGVHDAVVEQLSVLSPAARELVAVVAVVGCPERESMLYAMSAIGDYRGRAALSEALRAGLLSETDRGEVHVRCELVRESVYASLSGPERRRWHARVAECLRSDSTEAATRVAQHYRAAGCRRRWVHHSELAAAHAVADHDEPQACEILLEVLASSWLPAAVRVRLATQLGRFAHDGRASVAAAAVLHELLEEGGLAASARGELRFLLAQAMVEAGGPGTDASGFAAALPDLGTSPVYATRAMLKLADPMNPAGTVADHQRWLDLATAKASGIDDAELAMAVRARRGAFLTSVGDARAIEAVAELVAGVGSDGELREIARGFMWSALGAANLGQHARAEELTANATEVIDRASYFALRPAIDAIRLWLDWTSGRWRGLQARCEALIDHAVSTPPIAMLIVDLLRLARGGSADSAWGLVATAEGAPGTGSLPVCLAASAARSRHLLASRSPAAALRSLTPALSALRQKGIWVWGGGAVLSATDALIKLDRIPDAVDLMAELRENIAGCDAPVAETCLLMCDASIADVADDPKRASARLEAAVQRWTAMPWPYEAALAMERWGRTLLRTDRSQAVSILTSAAETLSRLGDGTAAARCRRTLRPHGGPRRGRGHSRALSTREEAVLRLAGEGRTNAEIGRILFISKRTVESHLSHARQKVGLVGRLDRGRWTRVAPVG